jgi:hypothetical protein
MLVRAASSLKQNHFAHTGSVIWTHTGADHHCRVRAHQNNKRYPTARRGQSQPCAVESQFRHIPHLELRLNRHTQRIKGTLRELVRSALVRGRMVVSAKDSVVFNPPRLAHLRVVR